MKKIVVLISALVLAASASAAAFNVAAAETPGPAANSSVRGIIALNHAAKITGTSTMQKAIDAMVAKAAAQKAAAEEAARQAAAQQQAANQGSAGNGGGSDSGSAEAAPASGGGGEDIWGVLASFGVPDTSIAYGDTHGYEAISYYKTGYIVINPNHTYDLYTLVAHEIDHIVAYRESGKTTEN